MGSVGAAAARARLRPCTRGHLAGDAVLAALSTAMRALVRDYDLVGRFGGEEFIILLPHTGDSAAREIAERLRVKLAQISVTSAPAPVRRGRCGSPCRSASPAWASPAAISTT